MKNCNEMVNSLLERRDQYEADKRRKRKMLTRTLTPICCVCLIALIGFGAWQGGMFNVFNTDNELTAEDALYPGIKDWYDPGESETENANENSQSDGKDQTIGENQTIIAEEQKSKKIEDIPDILYSSNESVESNYGTLKLTENNRAEGKCTFVFEKTGYHSLGFCLKGSVEVSRRTEENGVELIKYEHYHILTPCAGNYDSYRETNDVPINHIVLDDQFKITVNGQTVSELPTEPGNYEITLDYSSLYELLDVVDTEISAFGFGLFSLDD